MTAPLRIRGKLDDEGKPDGFQENGPGPDLQCRECSCDTEGTKVRGGLLSLPRGWRWHVMRCNWGPGWYLEPVCPDCIRAGVRP